MVKRVSKTQKHVPRLQLFLGENVEILRDRKYAKLANMTARNRQLEKDSNVSISQIRRIIERKLGTSIDYVEMLAAAFEVSPTDLLTPYFAVSQTGKDAGKPSPARGKLHPKRDDDNHDAPTEPT